MSATNFTPIQLYRTTTASAAPSAGNLADGELAINLTDEKLYFKNAAGVVKMLASSAGALGTVSSVAVSGGTTGLTTSGGPITTSGTITLAGTLGVANGGTGTNTQFTAGSVVFAGASGVYSQDNANLFWDDSNNRLGIGTATPGVTLDVNGQARASTLYATSSTASSFVSRLTNADFQLYAANGVATGNSGDVKATIGLYYADTLANLNGGIQFTRGGSGTDGWMNFLTSGTERMRIDASGNLGLGVTPSAWGSSFRAIQFGTTGSAFTFAGTTNIGANFYYDSAGTGRYLTNNFAGHYQLADGQHRWYIAASGTAGNAISFTQAMTLDASGNLLVGTTANPQNSKLMVSGTAQVKPAANNSLEIFGPNTGTGIRLFARNDAGTPNRLELQGGQVIFPLTTGADGLYFDATFGNLGLGVTPSAWGAFKPALQIGTASLSQIANRAYLTANGFYNGSAWTYNATDFATQYFQQNGQHIWNTAPSGTAGNAISFTQAMTLDASGNLGVGVTSPFADTGYTSVDVRGSTGGQINFGSGANRFAQISSDTTNGLTLNTISTRPLRFFTNGTEAMRILSSGEVLINRTGASGYGKLNVDGGADFTGGNVLLCRDTGNVGIGTSSPGSKLQVNAASTGTAFIVSSSGVGVQALGAYLGSGVAYWGDSGALNGMGVSTASNYANFITNNTERMRIDSSGNVGIGTSSPSYLLHLNQNGNTQAWISATNAGSNSAGIGFENQGQRNWQIWADRTNDALQFGNNSRATVNMVINSSGNVGIGTSSPGSKLEVTGNIHASSGGDTRKVLVGLLGAGIEYNVDGSTILQGRSDSYPLLFKTNNAERARIDSSGNLLVGQTAGGLQDSNSVFIGPASPWLGLIDVSHATGSATGNGYVRFGYAGTQIGSVSQNGTTGVLYNTSSDARLKHDIVDAPEASSLIDAIKVRSFKWNADNSEQRYGMVAQELLEVAPEAVSVPADEDEMMGVDYSKLVPMLVKEIQSLRARVAQLEGN